MIFLSLLINYDHICTGLESIAEANNLAKLQTHATWNYGGLKNEERLGFDMVDIADEIKEAKDS